MGYKRTDPKVPDDNAHSDNDRLSAHDKGISAPLTDSLTGVLKNDVIWMTHAQKDYAKSTAFPTDLPYPVLTA